MNPPYQAAVKPFIRKLITHYDAGDVTAAVVLLSIAHTDMEWFRPLYSRAVMCFTYGRIAFTGVDGVTRRHPSLGSVIAYLGPYPERFAGEFRSLGAILTEPGPPRSSAPASVRAGRSAGSVS